jgi:proline iminopeptidase
MKIARFCILASMIISAACTHKNRLQPGEGYIHLKEGKVWYKIVGTGDKTPLILLHGGPGVPSYYLNSMGALGNERPVIFFDQLGCGRSDRDIDSSLLTIENFTNELKSLLTRSILRRFFYTDIPGEPCWV